MPNPAVYIPSYLLTMKRAASITLLFTLLCLALAPLMADAQRSHPVGCPRVASHHHCEGGQTAEGERVVDARPADCPMRCCAVARAGTAFGPAPRIALTALDSAFFENEVPFYSTFVPDSQVCFERGPPLA